MYSPVLPIAQQSKEKLSAREQRQAEERFYQDYTDLDAPRRLAWLKGVFARFFALLNARIDRTKICHTAEDGQRCGRYDQDAPTSTDHATRLKAC